MSMSDSVSGKSTPPGGRTSPSSSLDTRFVVSNETVAKRGKRPRCLLKNLEDTKVVDKKDNLLQERFKKHYRLEKKLVGDNAVSNPFQVQVRLATHLKSGDRRVVKVLNKETVDMPKIRREIATMKGLAHENVVQFYEAFEDDRHVYVCMEYVKGGELFDQLIKQGRYSERKAAHIIRGIIKGLQHIHDAGIAHCDIKPENIMFASEDVDSPVKIIDFGMAQRVTRGKIGWLTDQCGTYAYRSPEQLDQKYTRACDMWAVGVTTFMLLTGFGPFHTNSPRKTIKRIREGFHAEIREGYGNWFPASLRISRGAMSLITQLLDREDFRRLNPAEALNHPWLQQADVPREKLLAERVVEHLQSAAAMTKFNLAICTALSQWIPKGEVYLLEKAFQESDSNGDGLISIDEFRDVVQRFNQGHKQPMSEEQLIRVFNDADVNGDHFIDYKELIMACVHHRLLSSEERLWRVFSELDANNDNYITTEELARVLGKRSSEAEELLKEVDTNHDGKISYSEFLDVWKPYC